MVIRKKTLIAALCMICMSLNVFAQNFSANIASTTVKKAIAELKAQTGYSFVYVSSDIDGSKTVKVNASSINEAVDQILAGQNCTYVIEGKNVVVSKKAVSAVKGGKIAVSGTVFEDTGNPAVGVVIMEKGDNTNAAVTDFEGNYTINVPANAILELSSLGFKTVEIPVGGRDNFKTTLEVDASALDQSVVIGYGTAKKSDLTGSIASLNTEQILNVAPKNVEEVLRNNIPGIKVKMQNNARSWSDNVELRGDNNFDSSGYILYVIDGVIYDGTSDDINPNDIATIDVLKDASALSVYGSRAQNGVICITTKKGERHADGRPVVNFDSNVSLVRQSHAPAVMNVASYLAYKEQYWHNAKGKDIDNKGYYSNPFNLPEGVDIATWAGYNKYKGDLNDKEGLTREWLINRLSLESIEADNYLKGVDTNWNDIVFHTGLQQSYNASVSQATERTNQFFSLNYTDRESAAVGDHYGIIRARVNLDQKVTDWLSIGLNSQWTSRDESGDRCKYDKAYRLSPLATDTHTIVDDPYAYEPTGNSKQENPLYKYYYRDKSDINQHMDSNIYAKVKLPWHFDYQCNFTTTFQWNTYAEHDAAGTQCDDDNGFTFRYSERGSGWSFDHILHYNNDFNGSNHRLEGTLLYNCEVNKWFSHGFEASDFSPNDQFTWHLPQAAANFDYASYTVDMNEQAEAYMARLFYAYKDKHMFTLTGRYDSNSDCYYSLKSYAICPSFAYAWVFSKENFMKDVSWLDFGKLRLSYGLNAKNAGDASIGKIGLGRRAYLDEDNNPVSTVITYMEELANRALTYEKMKTANLGLDFGLFDGRLGGSIDAYWTDSFNLCRGRELPAFTGYSEIDVNAGSIINEGIEASLKGEIIRHKDFKWSMNGTLAFNHSSVNHIDGIYTLNFDDNGKLISKVENDNIDEGLWIGKPIGQIWDLKFDGIWTTDEAEEAEKYGLQPGDAKFIDVDGDYDYDEDDYFFLGKTQPSLQYSIGTTFEWKNWMLEIQGYGRGGNYWKSFGEFCVSGEKQRAYYDMPYWTEANQRQDYTRVDGDSDGNKYIRRGFFRLSDLSLSYTVPQKVVKKAGIKGLTLSVAGSNLFVIAPDWPKFWGDPEMDDEYVNRGVTFGLRLTL